MPEDTPPGHSIAAHTILGWCAACTAYGPLDEAEAWRDWAGQHVPDVKQAIRQRMEPQ